MKIHVGDKAEYSKTISDADVQTFAKLTGDHNPIHPAADVHEIAGPQLRGLGIGSYFFAVNVAAYAIGSPLVGLLNDKLGADRNPGQMRYALLLSPLACALSALFLWQGSRTACSSLK